MTDIYQQKLAELNAIEAELEDTRMYANEVDARKCSLEAKAQEVRNAIRQEMEGDAILSQIVDGYKLALRKRPDKYTYNDEATPEQFKTTKTVVEIDKALIKAFAKDNPEQAKAFVTIEKGGYDLVVQMVDTGKHRDINNKEAEHGN